MDNNMNLIPLYLAKDLQSLELLVKKDESYKNLKKAQRFTNITSKMKTELLQCQHDQEKCYILSRRYINIMDHVFKISDDKEYVQRLHLTDIRTVEDLIEKLKTDLCRRYQEVSMGVEVPETSTKTIEPSFVSSHSRRSSGPSRRRNPIFKDVFVTPSDVHKVIADQRDILIVDTRSMDDFVQAHLDVKIGHVINIPEAIIVPGLSANTLGKLLKEDVQEVWEKRDHFSVIILIDLDTNQSNYTGSKLERLRSFIVEWDLNRNYEQDPVVLNGGIREFVEWYPTQVAGSQFVLSKINSEIDELLYLDDIDYPEHNTPGYHNNLRIMSLTGDNVEYRFMQDAPDFEEPYEPESNLSDIKVLYDTTDLELSYGPANKDPDPVSNESSSQYTLPTFMYDDPGVWESLQSEKDRVKSSEDTVNEENVDKQRKNEDAIRHILQANKDFMLEQARKNKPQISPAVSTTTDDQAANKNIDELNDDIYITPPPVDRTAKPTFESSEDSRSTVNSTTGTGLTALKNLENNCFMNAILQSLKFLPVIKATYVTTNLFTNITTRQPPQLNYHFAHVMRILWQGTNDNSKSYWPESFKRKIEQLNPNYAKHHHEDAFEFFILLFTTISEDCAIEMPRPSVMTESEKAWYGQLQGVTSFFVDSFHHQLRNAKICLRCRETNLSFETDSTLMLPMPNRRCILQDLVDDYLKENMVPDYSCTKCKSTNTIVNKREIVVFPEVLVIVLKRYFMSNDGRVLKNESELEFPRQDLEFGREKYTLSSIIHHTGNMSVGHYYSSVLLDVKTDRWGLYNDESIRDCCQVERWLPNVRKEACGFFYVKKIRQPAPAVKKPPPS